MRLLVFVLFIASFSAYGRFAVNNQLTGTATTVSVKVLDPNSNRKYFLFQNIGAASASVKFGSAHSGSEGVWVPSGGSYEPLDPPIDSVYIKTAVGGSAYTILEGKD